MDERTNHESLVELGLCAETLSLRLVTAGKVVTSHTEDIPELRHVLGHRPLDGMTLEILIAMVEDIVMSPLRDMPSIDPLVLAGDELSQVVSLLPSACQGHAAASIEVVEVLFNQLADHAAGSPVAWRHATDPGGVVLGLVVLREVMHHGGFHRVSTAADAGG